MKIIMIGVGYVGLVSAAGFAEFGNEVICIDTNPIRLQCIEEGKIPFYEPNLQDLVNNNISAGRLSFTSKITSQIIEESEIIFITIGTPQGKKGEADLCDLYEFIEYLKTVIPKSKKLVVIKSTVPVGTSDEIRNLLKKVSDNWYTASNPEFLREGTAVEDFLRPDRVIIGISDKWEESILRRLYDPVSNVGPILVMDSCSAELTKYAANAMLAMRISFMNEIADIAEKCGADVELVRRGIGYDVRIGSKYIYPGPGFGGSCFTKDLYALIHTADKVRSHALMAKCTLEINEAQKHIPVIKLHSLIGSLDGKTVAVWGLAFKPLTDDIRDAPAIVVIEDLLKHGAKVRVHDPKAMENIRSIFGNSIEYSSSHYHAATGAHGIILMTEWREYRSPDFMYLKSLSPEVVIVDARNIWREEDVQAADIKYIRIGRARKTS